tara:strand:+ start:781 stop:1254 length:474 start_codon:yes stop_codon:yes gene_type:complete
MKLTKSELKQIIKEELDEGIMDKLMGVFGGGAPKDWPPMLSKYLAEMFKAAIEHNFTPDGADDTQGGIWNDSTEEGKAMILKLLLGQQGPDMLYDFGDHVNFDDETTAAMAQAFDNARASKIGWLNKHVDELLLKVVPSLKNSPHWKRRASLEKIRR